MAGRRGGRPTTTAETGFPIRRPGPPGPFGGKTFVPTGQRERLLDALLATIAENGYAGTRMRQVCERAGMSHKTFYDLFADLEDCFLALFDRTVDELGERARPEFEGDGEWSERVRAGLAVVLAYLDEHPQRARILFVEALGAGPRVLARRAEVLRALAGAVDEGCAQRKRGGSGARRQQPPPLTGESIIGAVTSMIHTRVCDLGVGARSDVGVLSELLNPLMATIVLPYRGHAAANKELVRRAGSGRPGQSGARSRRSGQDEPAKSNPLADLPIRLTYRTLAVLSAIGELGESSPGPSNHAVAVAAGIRDEGQASKLLAKLARLELIENAGPGHPSGAPNEWRLSARGQELMREVAPAPSSGDRVRGDARREAR